VLHCFLCKKKVAVIERRIDGQPVKCCALCQHPLFLAGKPFNSNKLRTTAAMYADAARAKNGSVS
jgi:hypothetical protein